MNKKKKPRIRFKGFTDDWEQRKVSDVAEICAGGTPRTGVPQYWFPKETPWLSSGEVHKKYITFTDNMISKEGMNNSNAKMIPVNSVLIALAGQGKTRGTVAINRIPLTTNQSIAAMIFSEDIISEFVFCNLENRYDELRMISSGAGSRGGLNKQLVGEIEIPYASCKEQQKIGDFFKVLNDLITLHQRKCEKLKIIKKSMLENCFPKNGQKVPKIRFSGFTGDWEQRKLGDITESFEYGLNVAAKKYDGQNKYLRITDIDDSTHEFLKKTLTSPDTDLSQVENYVLQEGDVLFARTGASVGKTYIYKQSDGLVYYAGFLIRARIKKDHDSKFVFQNTLTSDYDNYIRITSQRSGQPGVNAREYGEYTLMTPSLAEQQKIGKYFQNIDALITLHQSKLEKLQKIKKSMLERMFV
ncbi:restriction endonuclease subunit S [uncultured Megasphaera sp.]|uniref:restriction endonuclease subunit S n=1 Tax=uncultured Megasphaera sp. TaxID=165188 RepID=UPI0025FF97F9|nr:restriction endonuclease subunit S [uncultured Megasphaera sp.]